jgi:membrane-bound serine protease (ClpP class)
LFSSAVVGVSSFVVIGFIKIFPRLGSRRGFVLKTAQDDKFAYRAASPELEKLLGKVGETLTSLRPAGIAIFDGSRVDVVSEGGFLSKNTPVKVVKIEGRKVVVKVVK